MKTLTKRAVLTTALVALAFALASCSNGSTSTSSTGRVPPIASYYLRTTGGKYIITDVYAKGVTPPAVSAKRSETTAPSRAAVKFEEGQQVRVWYNGGLVGTGTIQVTTDPVTNKVIAISADDIKPPSSAAVPTPPVSEFKANVVNDGASIKFTEAKIVIIPTTSSGGTSGGDATPSAPETVIDTAAPAAGGDTIGSGEAVAGAPPADTTTTTANADETAAATLAAAFSANATATGTTVTVSGDAALTTTTVASKVTLTQTGGTLTIPNGMTLTVGTLTADALVVNGTVTVDGTSTVKGTITGTGTYNGVTIVTGSYELDSSGSTAGLSLAYAGTTGVLANWESESPTLFIKVIGTIAADKGGTYDTNTAISVPYGYGPTGSDQDITHYGLITIEGKDGALVLPKVTDSSNHKAYIFATITSLALPAYYLSDPIDTGKKSIDKAAGKYRFTHSNFTTGSTDETANIGTTKFPVAGSDSSTTLFWRGDTNKFFKLEFDGDDGPSGPHGLTVTIDFSGVVWE